MGRARERWQAATIAATLAKALLGIVVFAGTVMAWSALQGRLLLHTPLPGAEGPQGSCALWLVGSSSMARWTAAERDLAPWYVHNRGVGGALLPQITARFANEAPLPAPAGIVFYAGDNDLASGVSLEDAGQQFNRFVVAAHRRMTGTPLFVLSVKPSPVRHRQRALQARYNAVLQAMAAHDADVIYVDVTTSMLADRRGTSFFDADHLHLSAAGYKVWAREVRHALAARLPTTDLPKCTGEAPR